MPFGVADILLEMIPKIRETVFLLFLREMPHILSISFPNEAISHKEENIVRRITHFMLGPEAESRPDLVDEITRGAIFLSEVR